eukprot:748571-Hanusia_phi.AAC.1
MYNAEPPFGRFGSRAAALAELRQQAREAAACGPIPDRQGAVASGRHRIAPALTRMHVFSRGFDRCFRPSSSSNTCCPSSSTERLGATKTLEASRDDLESGILKLCWARRCCGGIGGFRSLNSLWPSGNAEVFQVGPVVQSSLQGDHRGASWGGGEREVEEYPACRLEVSLHLQREDVTGLRTETTTLRPSSTGSSSARFPPRSSWKTRSAQAPHPELTLSAC